jgi:hypothetical protein
MENKYYTPTIDEFYEGFEFELGLETTEFKVRMSEEGYPIRCSDKQTITEWITKKYEVSDFIGKKYKVSDLSGIIYVDEELLEITGMYNLQNYLDIDKIRVKYLDEQDIKSLGFTQTETIPHWFELKSKIQPGSYRLIYTYLEIDEKVLTGVSIIYFKGDYADPIVRGITIKNKSELKRLLNQLNIL